MTRNCCYILPEEYQNEGGFTLLEKIKLNFRITVANRTQYFNPIIDCKIYVKNESLDGRFCNDCLRKLFQKFLDTMENPIEDPSPEENFMNQFRIKNHEHDSEVSFLRNTLRGL